MQFLFTIYCPLTTVNTVSRILTTEQMPKTTLTGNPYVMEYVVQQNGSVVQYWGLTFRSVPMLLRDTIMFSKAF